LKTSATFRRTKITDFLLGFGKEKKKRKVSTLEYERLQLLHRKIEVYESSSHEERKSLSKTPKKKRTFSLHSTTTNHANDETEEKEEHLQTFSPAR
jgi:hypothetical protein